MKRKRGRIECTIDAEGWRRQSCEEGTNRVSKNGSRKKGSTKGKAEYSPFNDGN